MSKPAEATQFWGNARDIGVVAIAGLTFLGAVTYYYYLTALGIHVETATIDPMNILIVAVRTLVLNAMWIFIGGVIVAAVYFATKKYDFWRIRAYQMLLVAVAFAFLYLMGSLQGQASANALRHESSDLTKVIFKKGADIPRAPWLSHGSMDHRTVLILENHDAVYILSQGVNDQSEGMQAAEVFEISRSDINSLDTFIK